MKVVSTLLRRHATLKRRCYGVVGLLGLGSNGSASIDRPDPTMSSDSQSDLNFCLSYMTFNARKEPIPKSGDEYLAHPSCYRSLVRVTSTNRDYPVKLFMFGHLLRGLKVLYARYVLYTMSFLVLVIY